MSARAAEFWNPTRWDVCAHFATPRSGRARWGNSRNGTRTKTVLTEIGPVQIEVPRDRDASFGPVIVRKRQLRLDGIDEIVLTLPRAA